MNEFEKNQNQSENQDKFGQQGEGGKPAFDQFGEKGQQGQDDEEAIRQKKLQEAGTGGGQDFGEKGQQQQDFAEGGQGATDKGESER